MEPEQVQNIMDSMIKKLYDMELEELGRSGWQDEKLLSFAIAEIGEEIGFTQGFKCAFQLFMECKRE